jgi:hypothetical protein
MPLGRRAYKNIPRGIRTYSITNVAGQHELPAPTALFRVAKLLTRAAVIFLIASVIGAVGVLAYRTYAPDIPVAGAPLKEPPAGILGTGSRVLVDDGSCPRGQIKEVIGGNVPQRTPRIRTCIARGR